MVASQPERHVPQWLQTIDKKVARRAVRKSLKTQATFGKKLLRQALTCYNRDTVTR
jgi:hypothetical protein